jgi:cytochrome c biogenesis protein CcmG/thiol:disulfide interchange protein DsbE
MEQHAPAPLHKLQALALRRGFPDGKNRFHPQVVLCQHSIGMRLQQAQLQARARRRICRNPAMYLIGVPPGFQAQGVGQAHRRAHLKAASSKAHLCCCGLEALRERLHEQLERFRTPIEQPHSEVLLPKRRGLHGTVRPEHLQRRPRWGFDRELHVVLQHRTPLLLLQEGHVHPPNARLGSGLGGKVELEAVLNRIRREHDGIGREHHPGCIAVRSPTEVGHPPRQHLAGVDPHQKPQRGCPGILYRGGDLHLSAGYDPRGGHATEEAQLLCLEDTDSAASSKYNAHCSTGRCRTGRHRRRRRLFGADLQFLRRQSNGIPASMLRVHLLALSVAAVTALQAQERLPAVVLRALDGRPVHTDTLSNAGKPIVLNFWATWCKPCLLELATLHRLYPQWRAETGVRVIAISIDDARTSSRVAPFVRARRWEFEVYLDENSELRRALNITDIPHTVVLDGQGRIAWQHQSYSPGDEEQLAEVLRRLVEGSSGGQ